MHNERNPFPNPNRLRRTFPIEQVPIKPTISHDLAIVASVKGISDAGLMDYATRIARDFGGTGVRVDVLFADNSPNASSEVGLNQVRDFLLNQGIDFTSKHVPTPGKPHGINACLADVQAPYILSVDPNKPPFPGTLSGLYEEISTDGNLDLLSARVAKNPERPNPIPQHWNAAAAFIGRRECFPGYPPIMNDDEYALKLALATGKQFRVSDKHFVSDRSDVQGLRQMASRAARQHIGCIQIAHTSVVTAEGKTLHLAEAEAPRVTLGRLERIAMLYDYFLHAPLEAKLLIPQDIARKLAQRYNPYHIEEFEKFAGMLNENPNMCSW